MDIVSDINELQSLCQELKKMRIAGIKIRKRKVDIENKILDYLKNTDQAGISYRDVTLKSEDKCIFKRGRNEDKILKGSEYLEKMGIVGGSQIVTNLLQVIKGSPISKSQLRMIQSSQAK